jgi:hypothetical protein
MAWSKSARIQRPQAWAARPGLTPAACHTRSGSSPASRSASRVSATAAASRPTSPDTSPPSRAAASMLRGDAETRLSPKVPACP